MWFWWRMKDQEETTHQWIKRMIGRDRMAHICRVSIDNVNLAVRKLSFPCNWYWALVFEMRRIEAIGPDDLLPIEICPFKTDPENSGAGK